MSKSGSSEHSRPAQQSSRVFQETLQRRLPRAFTEHGAIMAATVLNSPPAVQMSLFVVRAFVRMRAVFKERGDLAEKLALLESELKTRLDTREAALLDGIQHILRILDPPKIEIGFHVKEDAVPYRIKRRTARA